MLTKNDPTGVRRKAIQKMHDMIMGGGDVSLKRFLAACSYDMGLTRKTSKSYLQDLVDLGFIELDESQDLIHEVKKQP